MDGDSQPSVDTTPAVDEVTPPIPTQPAPSKIRRGFIRLRRDETCVQWGFRIIGGVDFNIPLQILKVTPQSLAAKKGMRSGDMVLKICGSLVKEMSNERAKMEILRAGNELDIVIERDLSLVPPKPTPKNKGRPKSAPNKDLESFQCVNPNLQSRSFKILQEALERMPISDPVDVGTPIVLRGSSDNASYASEEYESQEDQTYEQAPEEEIHVKTPVDGEYYHQDEVVTEPRG